jgi:hypothetical protein
MALTPDLDPGIELRPWEVVSVEERQESFLQSAARSAGRFGTAGKGSPDCAYATPTRISLKQVRQ